MAKCGKKATQEYKAAVEALESEANASIDGLLSLYNSTKTGRVRVANLGREGEKVPEELRGATLIGGKNWFSRAVQGIGTHLIRSDHLGMRGLAYKLFEMPQGGTARVGGTAAVDQQIFMNEIRGATRGIHNEALSDFYKEMGKSDLNVFNLKVDTEFNYQVYREIKNPGSSASPSVQRAAEAYRDMFEVAGQIQKRYGVGGFENLTPRAERDYAPTVMNHEAVIAKIGELEKTLGRGAGRQAMEDWLTMAYAGSKKQKLNMDQARILARGMIARAENRRLIAGGQARQIKNSDLDAMEKLLKQQGLDDEAIEAFLARAATSEGRLHVSDRAKFSFDPDVSIEHAGIRASDVFETNMEKLAESYAREASGNAAIAKHGFKTQNELQDTIMQLEENMRQHMPGDQVDQEIKMMKAGVDMLFSRLVDEGHASGVVKGAGAFRSFTAWLRLTAHGFASFPESARSMVERGFSVSMKSMPSLKEQILSAKHGREGGKASGEYLDPVMAEADYLYRYLGEDQILDFRGVAVDHIEEATKSRYGKAFEKAMAKGQYWSTYTSFFRAIQGGGEKLAGRSLILAMKNEAQGIKKGVLREIEIKEAGWGDGFYEKFLEWGKANLKEVEFDGKQVKVFDWDKLPPEDLHTLKTGMYRILKRKMQGQMVGETSLWMNTQVGKFLTQFRTFSIASLEKQLLHDVKFDKAAGATMAAVALAMSLSMHVALSHVKAALLPPKERKKAIDAALSTPGMVMGSLNRVGQLASLGIALDIGATFGLLPDSMTQVGTPGAARALSPDAIPAIGVLSDMKNLASAPARVAKGEITPGQGLNKLQKLVPLLNIMGVQSAWNALEHNLDE